MDFEKIKYFLALADTLNYTKASQRLYISQSMLSRHIMALEEEIGMALFIRNSHGVSLTPVGAYMKNGLKSIGNEYELVLKQAQIIDSGRSGDLRIGIITATTLVHVYTLLTRYMNQHPQLRISISAPNSLNDMWQSLSKNHIDLGFGMRLDQPFPMLSSMKICNCSLALVMSKHHPLSGAPEGGLSIRDFQGDTFITPVDEISTAYKRLIDRCAKAGFQPKVITVPDIMSVALWVELNRGVTFLHDFSVLLDNQNLVHHYLNDIETVEPYNVYWNPNHQNPAAIAFLDYLHTQTGESYR